MRRTGLLTTLAAVLLTIGCNLGQLTDTSGPDDTVSEVGIGSAWLGTPGGTDGPGNDDHPLVGEWSVSLAGCGSPSVRLTLNGDSNGSIWYRDCQTNCAAGQVGLFRWESSGIASGQLTFNYTSFSVCGQQGNTPAPDSRPYSFTGPNLQFAGVSWTKTG